MTTQNKVIVGIIVALLVLVGFTFYAANKDDSKNQPQNNNTATNETPGSKPISGNLITARRAYENGKHIIAGEVDVPNPCTSVTAGAVVAESMPEQVNIKFTTTGEGDMCAQVIAKRRFKVEFNASQNAKISATWNGNPITLNLVPSTIPELESFDIYIKG